ncbi:hypothetical protein CEXT_19331 [Caerostris extrusa]|uniref:Uncharacterized protein n=1 Tax=Caerostris extrusa TaxID=172846 RepID=A0AAV4Y251_CAEEX|nr:hypothetical protein CEXT_19331 [Caerostris extrusa]
MEEEIEKWKEIKQSATEGHANPESINDDKIQDVTNKVQAQIHEEIQESIREDEAQASKKIDNESTIKKEQKQQVKMIAMNQKKMKFLN